MLCVNKWDGVRLNRKIPSIKHDTDWCILVKQHTNTHSDTKMNTKYIHEQRYCNPKTDDRRVLLATIYNKTYNSRVVGNQTNQYPGLVTTELANLSVYLSMCLERSSSLIP